MRIARALALAGIDSRRKCEKYVLEGRVELNGDVVLDLGRQVDPGRDKLTFNGKRIRFQQQVYYILNKPAGYVTTAGDPFAKKTVFQLLPKKLTSAVQKKSDVRVFPVGRLDKESTGLLLFTNDGEMANRLMHPRYHIEKWYAVKLDKPISAEVKRKVLKGVRFKEGFAKIEKIKELSQLNYQLMLTEGKKREIRRIFEKFGYHVVKLNRISYGPLKLGSLERGKGRFLTGSEIEKLKLAVS